MQGHALNQTRLVEQGIEFEQVISLLSKRLINKKLIKSPASEKQSNDLQLIFKIC